MTQIATVSTYGRSIRDEIDGWTIEDSSLLVRKEDPSRPGRIFVGYTGAPRGIPLYGTVFEMLADGWKLLGPPTEATDESWTTWEWWLTRESK